jgi:hypothetical protein
LSWRQSRRNGWLARHSGQQGRGDSSIHSRPCLALGRAFKPSTRTRRLRYRDAQGSAPYDCLAYGIIIHSPDDLTLAGAQRSKNCALASQESSHIALHSDSPTCDRRTTSPGAFKQLRGSSFAFAKRSVICAEFNANSHTLGLRECYRMMRSNCRRRRFGLAF